MGEETKTTADHGRWWVTAPDAIAPQRSSNLAAGESEPPRRTVWQMFQETVAKHRHGVALAGIAPDADSGSTERTQLTWSEYYGEVRRFARALVAIDFTPFRSVNIIGFNHARWAIASLGCMAAGGLAAGVYTTNKPPAVQYIAAHSEAEVLVVEDSKQLRKYAEVAGDLPLLKAVVMYSQKLTNADRSLWMESGSAAKLYNWREFVALGAEGQLDSEVDTRMERQKPGSCAMLIYTSGTTGPPKAVMISHDNLTFTAHAVLKRVFNVTSADRVISYLPLSHIAGAIIDIMTPMSSGASTWFALPSALKGGLVDELKASQPTIFFGVPRVWEKIREKLEPRFNAATGGKAKLLRWARGKGTTHTRNIEHGGSGGSPCCFGLANKLVFKKLRAALGMQKTRILATGAAPIARETLEFFASLDMPIYEVFGQSECTGPQTQNRPDPAGGAGVFKMGTSGTAIPMAFMAVQTPSAAGDCPRKAEGEGEVVYSGRHIMMGYLKNPEKSAEAIDDDGYLHSGDKGVIDSDGYLRITGRYKELLVTAGGENVAPVLIEQAWRAESAAISNVMVVGDRRKYLTALVTLKVEVDLDSLVPSRILAEPALEVGREIGSTARTTEEASADPKWVEHINSVMERANKGAISRAQTVRKWRLLLDDFSVPGGELTATLKLKRPVALKNNLAVVDGMYEEAFKKSA